MTPIMSLSITEKEAKEAVERAVKACSMCPRDKWQELAEHMKIPGVAIAIGQSLEGIPESEWPDILTQTLEEATLLGRLFKDYPEELRG